MVTEAFERAYYSVKQSWDGSPESLNPLGRSCAAVARIRSRFDTHILGVQDAASLSADIIESIRCSIELGLKVILSFHLYPRMVIEGHRDLPWTSAYYQAYLVEVFGLLEELETLLGVPLDWIIDCEWYGFHPFRAFRDAPLSPEYAYQFLYQRQLDCAAYAGLGSSTGSYRSPVCGWPFGSQVPDRASHSYMGWSERMIVWEQRYKAIWKDQAATQEIKQNPNQWPVWSDPIRATKGIAKAYLVDSVNTVFQPKGSSVWYQPWLLSELPPTRDGAGTIVAPQVVYVDQASAKRFIQSL